MAAPVPTHRKAEGKPWQRFNEVTGRWDDMPKAPTERFKRLQTAVEWTYFADLKHQPVRVSGPQSTQMSHTEKTVLRRLLADADQTLRLFRQIDPGLPATATLTDVRDYLNEILETGYWLDEDPH